jgi:hypothetical protein
MDGDEQGTALNLPAAGTQPAGAAAQPLAQLVGRIEFRIDPADMVIKGRHGLRIHVKNNTDRALIFSGEKASAKSGEAVFSCMDIRDFDELFAAPPNFAASWSIGARETVKAAFTVGAFPALNDMLKGRPGPGYYGKDELRRQGEDDRFGQRVLWPGESSSGILLFRSEQSLVGAQVTLPVSSFFNTKEQSEITGVAGQAQ